MEKFRQTLRVRQERAILVAAVLKGVDESDDLVELTSLAQSAGAVVVDRFQHTRFLTYQQSPVAG